MGRRDRALGLAALLLFVACITGCGLLVSWDSYDVSLGGDGNGVTYEVRGTIDGLGTAKAVLVLNGNAAAAITVGDGEFRFTERIADGASYGVGLLAEVPGHPCTFERERGTVAGADVTGIAIHCPVSHDADLVSLLVSAGDLSPTFDPKIEAYTTKPAGVPRLFPPPPVTTVTAKAHDSGATIAVGGKPAGVGSANTPVPLVDGPNSIDVLVTAADGVTTRHYAVAFSGTQSIDYLKASNPRSGATFGVSVAISGDTMVVGAPKERSLAKGVNAPPEPYSTSVPNTYAGAVYVFTRTKGVWSQQAYLKASNTHDGSGAEFGTSVALSGDTLVVGAPFEASKATGVNGDQADVSALAAGAAYVFTRTGATWSQQAYLKASNTSAGAFFGYAVAVSGDTAAIGASFDGGSGAAYVFTRTGTAWSQQAYVKVTTPSAAPQLGASIALAGDTLAVGAPNESSNASGIDGNEADTSLGSSGAAYVFTRTGTTWSRQAYVKASNPTVNAGFGVSIALLGDTLAVGAYGARSDIMNMAIAEGGAYVFARAGTAWSQQAFVRPAQPQPGATFGRSVALAENTLVVGSDNESGSSKGIDGDQAAQSAGQAGAAFVFTRTGTSWSQRHYLKATNPRADARFGISVATSKDTVVVGSLAESSKAMGVNGDATDTSLAEAGAAYVFR